MKNVPWSSKSPLIILNQSNILMQFCHPTWLTFFGTLCALLPRPTGAPGRGSSLYTIFRSLMFVCTMTSTAAFWRLFGGVGVLGIGPPLITLLMSLRVHGPSGLQAWVLTLFCWSSGCHHVFMMEWWKWSLICEWRTVCPIASFHLSYCTLISPPPHKCGGGGACGCARAPTNRICSINHQKVKLVISTAEQLHVKKDIRDNYKHSAVFSHKQSKTAWIRPTGTYMTCLITSWHMHEKRNHSNETYLSLTAALMTWDAPLSLYKALIRFQPQFH